MSPATSFSPGFQKNSNSDFGAYGEAYERFACTLNLVVGRRGVGPYTKIRENGKRGWTGTS